MYSKFSYISKVFLRMIITLSFLPTSSQGSAFFQPIDWEEHGQRLPHESENHSIPTAVVTFDSMFEAQEYRDLMEGDSSLIALEHILTNFYSFYVNLKEAYWCDEGDTLPTALEHL